MSDEGAWALFLALIALVFLVYGLAFLAGVLFVIAAILAYLEYRDYLKEAMEDAEEQILETNTDFPIDDLFASVGIEVTEVGGYESVVDMMAGATPIGVSEQ
jgi:uncharacterized membrane protein